VDDLTLVVGHDKFFVRCKNSAPTEIAGHQPRFFTGGSVVWKILPIDIFRAGAM